MQEKELDKELDKAIGNVEIEGHSIPKHEKDIVSRVYQKYKDRIGTDAVDSLLYNLVEETKKMEQENGRSK